VGIYRGKFAEVRIDPTRVAALLRGPQGPLVRNLFERGERVRVRAKELVGKDTHKLEHSIVKRMGEDASGPFCLVGSEEPHAELHHDGTRPHEIVPRRARVLRFPASGGGYVFAMRVNHPGTKPNPYLTNALQAARD